MDRREEFRLLRKTGREERVSIERQLHDLLFQEEIIWKQHLWVNLLKHGDQNICFFHIMASSRKHKNTISFLEYQGKVIQYPLLIKKVFTSYFSNILGSTTHHNLHIDWKHLYLEECIDLSALEDPFIEEEIKDNIL